MFIDSNHSRANIITLSATSLLFGMQVHPDAYEGEIVYHTQYLIHWAL